MTAIYSTPHVSTRILVGGPASDIRRLQAEIEKSQTEAATNRMANPALELGQQNGLRLRLEGEVQVLESRVQAYDLATVRLSVTQSALTAIKQQGEQFSQSLITAVGGVTDGNFIAATAEATLQGFRSAMNTSAGGDHLFAGIDSGSAPIGDLSAIRSDIVATFTARFGFPPGDPASQNLAPDLVVDFLQNDLQPRLTGTAWTSLVSGASDEAVKLRTGTGDTVDISISANESAMRGVMAAALMTAELAPYLNADSVAALARTSTDILAQGLADTNVLQTRIGLTTGQIDNATAADNARRAGLETVSEDMVRVDPFEAASRFNAQVTQLETAYALTGRLQGLSLLRFL
ncbi:flagellar hook-associated family protein [Ahrensia sp. R2A130]|uniref:flagellar hook-associated family protein n=1 Tax=Ahrensia sp. R2A130 TaxID=744979 RepID=UPI0001E0F86A|nr:flagellar hook-associated family protein [Ahrensia sp. R2A130]EFL89481.1 putative flagellar hook-associated protein FlgL [Ahrensia sp. R2A130]